MKVWIAMDRRAAMRAGHDVREYEAVEVDLTVLTPEQKVTLAEHHEVLQYDRGDVHKGDYALYSTRGTPHIMLPLSTEASQVAVVALLDAIPTIIREHQQAEAEREAKRQAEREAEREARAVARANAIAALAAMDDAALLADATHQEVGAPPGVLESDRNHRWRDVLDHYPRPDREPLADDLRPIIERFERLLAEHNERAYTEYAAREAAEHAAMAAWAEEHGSTRLRRSLAEGIECAAVYRDERLAAERPGWQWANDVAGEYDDPRNPPESALDLLDVARQHDPQATLVWWTDEHSCTEDCYGRDCPEYDRREYACVATFMDREIVLFAQAE